MKSTVLGIRERISEIRKAVDSKMFLSALSLALTVPDICGKLENVNLDDKQKYIKWFNDHVSTKYFPEIVLEENDEMGMGEKRALTGERCYGLRCAVLHSGNQVLNKAHMDLDLSNGYTVTKYKLCLLDDPHDEMLHMDGNAIEKKYEVTFYLNIRKFCERICQAAEETLEHVSLELAEEQYSIEILRYESR